MNHQDTFEQWQRALRIFHRAHSRAATLFEQRNIALGLPTVILTAIAGTTVFATIEASPAPWVKVLIGIMSLAAAVLAALQTFLRYAELAERHKAAAQKYGILRRELEEAMAHAAAATHPAPLPPAFTTSFRERWAELEMQSPNLPQKIYDQSEAHVKARLAEGADVHREPAAAN